MILSRLAQDLYSFSVLLASPPKHGLPHGGFTQFPQSSRTNCERYIEIVSDLPRLISADSTYYSTLNHFVFSADLTSLNNAPIKHQQMISSNLTFALLIAQQTSPAAYGAFDAK
jgi:hypothetical protein